MTNDLSIHLQMNFEVEEQRKQRDRASRKKHKESKCGTIQVFLDKETVEAFKACVKANGHNQAGIIRTCIENYMAGSEKKHGAY